MLAPRADPAPQQDTGFKAGRAPQSWTPDGRWLCPCPLPPPLLLPPPPPPQSLFRNPWALTSDMFISSISANVGALSRTRGRWRWALLPASVMDRLMQEVDLTSPEQALRMQGREPNPGAGSR